MLTRGGQSGISEADRAFKESGIMNLFAGTMHTGFNPKHLTYKRAEKAVEVLEQLEMLIFGSQGLEGKDNDVVLCDIVDHINIAKLLLRGWFAEHGHELRGAPKELVEFVKKKEGKK